jgi:hypothetical protein
VHAVVMNRLMDVYHTSSQQVRVVRVLASSAYQLGEHTSRADIFDTHPGIAFITLNYTAN